MQDLPQGPLAGPHRSQEEMESRGGHGQREPAGRSGTEGPGSPVEGCVVWSAEVPAAGEEGRGERSVPRLEGVDPPRGTQPQMGYTGQIFVSR